MKHPEQLRYLYCLATHAARIARLECFDVLGTCLDETAAQLLYADDGPEAQQVAYANLAHNFHNAQMCLRGMQWRIESANFRRSSGPDMTTEEIQAIIDRLDRVLVENGRDMVELLATILVTA